MVNLNFLLLIIFIISLIVFLEKSLKVNNFIKKNLITQENIAVFKDLKGLSRLILVISIAFIINSISFIIITENSLFFYIYFILTSLIEISLIENFIRVKYLIKQKLDPELFIKKAKRINNYNVLPLVIYFVVYTYVVLHFFLFK